METILLFSIGLILGIKHAFDADHIIAVNTLLTQTNKLLKTIIIATWWGIGHTSTLLITSILLLTLNLTISHNTALFLELLVGIMLIIMGISNIHKKLESKLKKINNNKKSLFIGMIHGLAGSAAIILIILTQTSNIFQNIFYISLFGLGSIIGMILISTFLHYSFTLLPNKKHLNSIAGTFSIILGILIIYQIAFVEKLFYI